MELKAFTRDAPTAAALQATLDDATARFVAARERRCSDEAALTALRALDELPEAAPPVFEAVSLVLGVKPADFSMLKQTLLPRVRERILKYDAKDLSAETSKTLGRVKLGDEAAASAPAEPASAAAAVAALRGWAKALIALDDANDRVKLHVERAAPSDALQLACEAWCVILGVDGPVHSYSAALALAAEAEAEAPDGAPESAADEEAEESAIASLQTKQFRLREFVYLLQRDISRTKRDGQQQVDDARNEMETLRQRHLMTWRQIFNQEAQGGRSRLSGIAKEACVAVMLLLAPPDKDAPDKKPADEAEGGKPKDGAKAEKAALDKKMISFYSTHRSSTSAVRALTAKMDEAMEQIATGEEVEGRDDARWQQIGAVLQTLLKAHKTESLRDYEAMIKYAASVVTLREMSLELKQKAQQLDGFRWSSSASRPNSRRSRRSRRASARRVGQGGRRARQGARPRRIARAHPRRAAPRRRRRGERARAHRRVARSEARARLLRATRARRVGRGRRRPDHRLAAPRVRARGAVVGLDHDGARGRAAPQGARARVVRRGARQGRCEQRRRGGGGGDGGPHAHRGRARSVRRRGRQVRQGLRAAHARAAGARVERAAAARQAGGGRRQGRGEARQAARARDGARRLRARPRARVGVGGASRSCREAAAACR